VQGTEYRTRDKRRGLTTWMAAGLPSIAIVCRVPARYPRPLVAEPMPLGYRFRFQGGHPLEGC